jgi:hypothetical protein
MDGLRHFFTLKTRKHQKRSSILYLEGLRTFKACTIRGQSWSAALHAMKVSSVVDIVGIWEYAKHIYILRKHPGLAMLRKEEKDQGNLDEEEESRDQY